jgi:hypothetical protein
MDQVARGLKAIAKTGAQADPFFVPSATNARAIPPADGPNRRQRGGFMSAAAARGVHGGGVLRHVRSAWEIP